MRAWVCRRYVDPFELTIEDVPVPEPGPGEVLIEVAAAGFAFGETLVLNGTYQVRPPLPYTPSNELAGIVRAVGDAVDRVKPGDRVAAFSFNLHGGGMAEFAVMPQDYVFALSDRLTFDQGAAFPVNSWTAFNALYRRGRLEAGETLVVHGATGGIGVAAVQVGKAMGATVIATGGDDARLEVVRRLGADHVVNHRRSDVREAIKGLTGGRGADVFIDPVGGDLFDASMRAIAPGGRILVVGFTSGQWSQARTNVLLVKMAAVIGVEARLAIETTGGQGMADFNRMLDWIDDGRIVPFVSQVYPFEAVADGFGDILARTHVGKCVLSVNPNL